MPRYVVYGAGAIGGVVGARLHQHGHDVVLLARGAHYEAIRDRGLTVEDAHESHTLRIPVANTPADIDLTEDDVVLLATKSQDTTGALDALRAATEHALPIVSLQN